MVNLGGQVLRHARAVRWHEQHRHDQDDQRQSDVNRRLDTGVVYLLHFDRPFHGPMLQYRAPAPGVAAVTRRVGLRGLNRVGAASALLGDHGRAKRAMRYAEEAAAAVPAGQMTVSPWSFPDERMTMFRVAVALGTNDQAAALDAADGWDTDDAAGRPHVQAAWAQIRIGAGIAHLLTDSLDGAAEEIAPVLRLPPEFRIVTVTGWLADLDRRLAAGRFAASPLAVELRQQIREFSGGAVTTGRLKEGS